MPEAGSKLPRDASMISVRFESDENEYHRFRRDIMLFSPKRRWLRVGATMLPLAVLGGAAGMILGGVATATQAASIMWPWLALSGLWLFLVKHGWRIPPPRAWRHDAGVIEERGVSQSGLDVAGGIDSAFVPWHRISAVRESSDFVLFFTDDAAYYIPRRHLSEETLQEIRVLVAAHTHGARPGSRLASGAKPATK